MKDKLIAILSAVILISCSGRESIKERNISPSAGPTKAEADAIIRSLKSFNESVPSILQGSFTLTGEKGPKKFKVTGNISGDRDKDRFKINFSDYIFRTPIAEITYESGNIIINLQTEGRVIHDIADALTLKKYADIDIDFYFFLSLIRGEIPLITGYTISGYADDGGRNNLKLENGGYYEILSGTGGAVPDRLILADKKSLEKTEIYISGIVYEKNIHYFSGFKIVIPSKKIDLQINFSKVKILSAP